MPRVPFHTRMPHLRHRNGPGFKRQFKDVYALVHRLIEQVQRWHHGNQIGRQRHGKRGTTLATLRFIPRSASASSTKPCNDPSGEATTWPHAT